MTVTIQVVPQIVKQTFDSLRSCNLNFRYAHVQNQFDILDVNRISYHSDDSTVYKIDAKPRSCEITNRIMFHISNMISIEIT